MLGPTRRTSIRPLRQVHLPPVNVNALTGEPKPGQNLNPKQCLQSPISRIEWDDLRPQVILTEFLYFKQILLSGRPFAQTAAPTAFKTPNKFVSATPNIANFEPPTFNQQPGRPPIQLQLREDNPVDLPPVFETKFKPPIRRNSDVEKIVIVDDDSSGLNDDGPIFRETARSSSVEIPSAPVSFSDEISGEDVNGVFAEVNFQNILPFPLQINISGLDYHHYFLLLCRIIYFLSQFCFCFGFRKKSFFVAHFSRPNR